MRFLALGLAVVACTPKASPEPDLAPLAETYVHLVLEIGAHEAGYIDAYYGPPEWKTEALEAPRSTAALEAAADALASDLGTALGQSQDPAVQRRARTLAAYVASARFRLDMIEGTRVPFADEAERLFALRPTVRPLESYDGALADLESLLAGPGPLADRAKAFQDRYIIPDDRLQTVIEAAIAECRRRTVAHLDLPANERFELQFVKDQPWGAYNWYQGDNHSLIQVNTDVPVHLDSAVVYGCHEGYPGHHVQGINAERLYRERGWVEYSVMPLFSPQGPLNEGGGDYGIALAFPGDEEAEFERTVLFPLAGLDPATEPAFTQFREATIALHGAKVTIGQMYIDGEVDRARAIELEQRYFLESPELAAQSVDFLDRYRSYIINYSTGEDVVRAWAERSGAEDAARWRSYEAMLTQPTLPADLR